MKSTDNRTALEKKHPIGYKPSTKKKKYNKCSLPVDASLIDRFECLASEQSKKFHHVEDFYRLAFSCLTEKPVYSPGEEVKISIVVVDKWSKKPYNQESKMICLDYFYVELKDANENRIGTLSGNFDEEVGVAYYTYKSEKDFSGGFYYVKCQCNGILVDSTKFFVTSVREKRNALVLDANKDRLLADDEVVVKASLRMLTKGNDFFQGPGAQLNYQVLITDQNFNVLQKIKLSLKNGADVFSFKTPKDIEGITGLVIKAEIFVEGQLLKASRQIAVKTINDLHMKFVAGGGKFVNGFNNQVFFAAFGGEDESVGVQVKNAKIIEIDDSKNETIIKENIKSNEDGRGMCHFFIKRDHEYYMEVSEGDLIKRFAILTHLDFLKNSSEKMEMVMMSIGRRVLKWNENLDVSIHLDKSKMGKKYSLVLLDKMRVIYEEKFKMDKKVDLLSIPVKNTDIQNGGVISVQLYNGGQTTKPVQETLIYLQPKEKLGVSIKFDKKKYIPGDKVNFEVEIEGREEGVVGVVVSDETSYLEIDRRNTPVSFISKIFLEKEFYFKTGEFVDSAKYIDSFFENNQNEEKNKIKKEDTLALECILGIQDWRLFFLNEEKLLDIIDQPENFKFQGLHYLLGLSPNQISLNKKPIYLFDDEEEEDEDECDGMMFDNEMLECLGFDGSNELEEMYYAEKSASESDDMDDCNSLIQYSRRSNSLDRSDIVKEDQNKKENEKFIKETDFEKNKNKNNLEENKKKMKSTIFWSQFKKTNNQKLVCNFDFPGLVKTFRITIMAMNSKGVYGTHTSWITVQKPFNTIINAPLFIRPGEIVICDLILENNLLNPMQIDIPKLNRKVTIPKKGITQVEVKVESEQMPYSIKIINKTTKEKISKTINIPYREGLTYTKTKSIKIDPSSSKNPPFQIEFPENIVPNSAEVFIEYKQVNSSLLINGLDKLVQEPYGCFEQTSATTFPMVMLVRYLDTIKKKTPDQLALKVKAEEKIQKGVSRLLGYECKSGGFEWFGDDPGHVTLTAYGIWQFIEMNKIKDYVDVAKIDRTLDWLRKKYQKKSGEFKNSTQGYDAFSRPPQFCSDIYIVFILTLLDDYHVNYESIVSNMISHYEKNNENDINDCYLESFIALVYKGMSKHQEAFKILEKLVSKQASNGSFEKAKTSITRSSGKSLIVETTSLALLCMLRIENDRWQNQIKKAIDFLLKNQNLGYFESTQATILAMRAMVEYMILSYKNLESKMFKIKLANQSLLLETGENHTNNKGKKYPDFNISIF